jgi:hypothetical protein
MKEKLAEQKALLNTQAQNLGQQVLGLQAQLDQVKSQLAQTMGALQLIQILSTEDVEKPKENEK